MTATTPTTFSPIKQFLGVATETVQGQPVAMTATALIDSLKPKDTPRFLSDQAWRGSMGTDSYREIAGVKSSTVSVGGPVFADTTPFFARNILGDMSVAGTATGSGSTTLSSSATIGAEGITTVASIPAGTLVQIDTGPLAECVTTGTPAGTGPYTIPITTPAGGLVFAHASAVAVKPVTGPFSYAFSLLNSGSGQPPSHTFTHYLGPTATSGARQYPGVCLSELDFKFNPEAELFNWTGQGTGYSSSPLATMPIANPDEDVEPIASWQATLGIGGTVAASPVDTVTDGEIDIKRELGLYWTANGSQELYIIQRGGLSVAGKLNFVAADESPLNYMLNNTKPSVQLVISNGLSGSGLLTVQFDIQVAAFEDVDVDTSKTAVGYQTSFKTEFNSTNAGGSGGQSPIKVTITNNIPPGQF